jgi:hypothetical protein
MSLFRIFGQARWENQKLQKKTGLHTIGVLMVISFQFFLHIWHQQKGGKNLGISSEFLDYFGLI